MDTKSIGFYKKLFAKVLDFTILYTALCLAALAWPFSVEDEVYLYLLILCPFAWIPLELVFYLIWGSTPGGNFLGIAPRSADGGPLKFRDALRLSLFLENKQGIRWVPYTQGLGRLLSRLTVGATVLIGLIFSKAVYQFPQEFERACGELGWKSYTSSEGDFSAAFPIEPVRDDKQLPIPQAKQTLDYSEYKAEQTKLSYSVSVLELPRKWRIFGSSTILKGALGVILDNLLHAKLITKTYVHHGTHPALDFHARGHERDIKGRLILVEGKLYKVEFSQPFNADEEEKGLAFIDSFQPIR